MPLNSGILKFMVSLNCWTIFHTFTKLITCETYMWLLSCFSGQNNITVVVSPAVKIVVLSYNILMVFLSIFLPILYLMSALLCSRHIFLSGSIKFFFYFKCFVEFCIIFVWPIVTLELKIKIWKCRKRVCIFMILV